MTLCRHILLFFRNDCKSGRLGIYFVNYRSYESTATQCGSARSFLTVLQSITEHWASVRIGLKKSNNNNGLSENCRDIEIDPEVNSIQVHRQLSQAGACMQAPRVANGIGKNQPDLNLWTTGTQISRTANSKDVADGHQ